MEMSLTMSNGALEIYEDEDIELFEVRYKRRTRETFLKHNSFHMLPESEMQVTRSQNHLFMEPPDFCRLKPIPQDDTNEGTNATSRLSPEDEIMADTIIDLTEEDCVKLPSVHELLPEPDHMPDPDGNIGRPYYNEWAHREGFVAWWDNRTGKGMIVNHRYTLDHKIELKDIKDSNYGALIPGSMVEYEYSDNGINKGFSKFWVVSGCEYVL